MNNTKLNILLGLFVGLLIGMNLLGGKITTLFGISVSVGIFMVPLTFLITDIVAEVYGKRTAKQFVLVGAFVLIVTFLYTALFVLLEPNERYSANEAYKTIFGASLRMMIASLVAFLLAQLHDVWAFEFWKGKTHGKLLWLRNNASTFVSQAIDTLVFMFIAFYHIAPKFDALFIIKLAIPYFLFKIAFAVIDTPFVYLGVRWLKGKEEKVQG
ncbi:MAG: queuosine precursor transporter [Patescibacteria group bacterium]